MIFRVAELRQIGDCLMIKILVRKFVKDCDNVHDNTVRERYGILGGTLGLLCNMLLFFIKLVIGGLMKSIAITSDAFNNLSDMGSSLVSIIGAKFSNKKPDKEHPFGHGRFEYISSLIVSFIIILVGFELLKTAADKIPNPQVVDLNFTMIAILILSVLVKVWMYSYNKYLGTKTGSGVLLAASKDSLNDVVSTLTIIAATLAAKLTGLLWLDGLIGVVVSLIIMKSGYDIAKDTIGTLLGKNPDCETVKKITKIILAGENIVGVHDLAVHDYGPGRVMASVHAEVPDTSNIVQIHEIIDRLEKKVEEEMGIHMVIHMDPISVNCERTNEVKKEVLEVVRTVDSRLNIHDFRMTDGENNINLIFDVEAPAECEDRENIPNIIAEKLKEKDSRYNAIITLDMVYDY